MAGILIFIGLGVSVRAADAGSDMTMTLQQTTKDAEIKEKPDQNANTLSELPTGTGVIVYGEPQNSWSQIEYDGVSGYIKSSALEAYAADDSAEELEQEFEEVREDTLRVIDEHELEQKSKRASMIWGIVIAVLVVAIFTVGVVSAIKKDKEEETEKVEEEKEEET